MSRFRREIPVIDEKIRLPSLTAPATRANTIKAVDFTGLVPLWFLIGPNGSGKTLFARWMAERAIKAGHNPVIAAADPGRRSLAGYIEGVEMPRSSDPRQTADFVAEFAEAARTEKFAGLIDMGGGDQALPLLAETAPGLVGELEAGGVGVVAAYFLGRRPSDLASLGTLEEHGFKPRATVLILNEALIDSSEDAETALDAMKRYPEFQAAVDRGAVVIHLPRLYQQGLGDEIEAKRLSFAHARDGTVPKGRKVDPIGGLDRSRVRRAMDLMETTFQPIAGWLL